MSARLLCVGSDVDLLRTRCDVLETAGHIASSVSVREAGTLLRTHRFDLIIVSAWLEEEEKAGLFMSAAKTPTLVLTGLTLAQDLLGQVKEILAQSR